MNGPVINSQQRTLPCLLLEATEKYLDQTVFPNARVEPTHGLSQYGKACQPEAFQLLSALCVHQKELERICRKEEIYGSENIAFLNIQVQIHFCDRCWFIGQSAKIMHDVNICCYVFNLGVWMDDIIVGDRSDQWDIANRQLYNRYKRAKIEYCLKDLSSITS